MVLVPQELSAGFIGTFWKFIKEGGYKFASRKNNDGDRRCVFYSFVDGKEGFPDQIELLSKPDELIGIPADHHIEYIDTGEEYSHLSAIILDSNYYDYLTAHFEMVDGIRYASADALVCLKALAYLNLLSDKQAGKKVNANDIKKHRRDGGEHNLRQYTAHLGKTEGAKMTATPAWYDSPEREQNTIPTMKPGMTAILITGDSARNKVQTMPGGGYASVKVELPGNWDALLED